MGVRLVEEVSKTLSMVELYLSLEIFAIDKHIAANLIEYWLFIRKW